jgi:hypothetical protein
MRRVKKAGRGAQVVEHLLGKHKVLSSNPSTAKRREEKRVKRCNNQTKLPF